MPVYNGQLFLREAIDSVQAQTYVNWELIVVDDGSTDSTSAILATYTDPRIVKFHQENRGEAGARNTGLRLARGEYIASLDADDLYLNSALTDMVNCLETDHDVDVIFSDGYFCDENGHPLMRISDHRPGPYTGMILEQLVLSPSVVAVPCSTLFRRLSAEVINLHYDTRLKYGVDWDFWIHMARYYRFGYLPKLTCSYRVHGANMTSAVTLQKRKDDLFTGRRKILESPWFDQLSVPTQSAFFYYVLVELLSDDLAMQQAILDTPQFRKLPSIDQAELYRAIATLDLLKRRDISRVRSQLRHALRVWPEDRKSQVLLALSNVSAESCRVAACSWGALRSGFNSMRPSRQRMPTPVPNALLPKS